MRRRFSSVTAILLAVALGCDAPTATRPDFAFDPTGLTGGTLFRWPTGSTVRVWVEAAGPNGTELIAAVDNAIAVWNAVPVFGEVSLERATSLFDAHVVVYDRSIANPLAPADCLYDPRGSGYTYFCLDDGLAQRMMTAPGEPSNATVLLTVDRGAVATRAEFDAVVAHELGHVLGIGGHSTEPSDLMYGNPTVTVPSARDRATLRYVLGQAPDALLR